LTIRSERLELVLLTRDAMAALADGRREEAESLTGVTFPSDWPDEHDARFLRFRDAQIARDPEHAPFLVRAITLPNADRRVMIGHIGFHGKPGVNAPKLASALELGYTVFPPYRRRGYAEEAIRALIDWAHDQHGIRTFIVSVSPENEPSLALARKMGFVEVGRHWDEEDGEELEFELRLA
jgi:ribosomal-protein-alanine N-acetyltransferase